MEPTSLRTNVLNTIMSCHCDQLGCEYKGKVKYDNFLHNLRIHTRCILCRLNCKSKKGIMDHLAFVHKEKTNCDICDFQVYPFERMKRHLFLTHKVCSKCGGKFESSMALEHHFETVHSDIKKLADSLRHSFTCDTCHFVGTKRALKMHKERGMHEFKKPPKLFKSPSKAQKMSPIHSKPKHIRVPPQPIATPKIQLTKLMPETKYEEQHVHEGDKVFICYLCDANFEDKGSVRRHLENGCKIFYCAKCNGKFKSKRNLEEHIVFAHYSQNNKGNYNFRLFMHKYIHSNGSRRINLIMRVSSDQFKLIKKVINTLWKNCHREIAIQCNLSLFVSSQHEFKVLI